MGLRNVGVILNEWRNGFYYFNLKLLMFDLLVIINIV